MEKNTDPEILYLAIPCLSGTFNPKIYFDGGFPAPDPENADLIIKRNSARFKHRSSLITANASHEGELNYLQKMAAINLNLKKYYMNTPVDEEDAIEGYIYHIIPSDDFYSIKESLKHYSESGDPSQRKMPERAKKILNNTKLRELSGYVTKEAIPANRILKVEKYIFTDSLTPTPEIQENSLTDQNNRPSATINHEIFPMKMEVGKGNLMGPIKRVSFSLNPFRQFRRSTQDDTVPLLHAEEEPSCSTEPDGTNSSEKSGSPRSPVVA